jgi:hypothetical protein
VQIFDNQQQSKGSIPIVSLQSLSSKFPDALPDKTSTFVCVGCNTPIFNGKDLTEHSLGTGDTCGCYFIKQKDWIQA